MSLSRSSVCQLCVFRKSRQKAPKKRLRKYRVHRNTELKKTKLIWITTELLSHVSQAKRSLLPRPVPGLQHLEFREKVFVAVQVAQEAHPGVTGRAAEAPRHCSV